MIPRFSAICDGMGPVVSMREADILALDNRQSYGSNPCVGFRAVNGAGKNQEPKDRSAQAAQT